MNTSNVLPLPPPNNDPQGVPLWPLIIAELKAEADKASDLASSKYGLDTDAARAKTIRAMIDDMKLRHEFGVAKYGVPLVAHNERDHLVDAYQELLDALVYLRADIEKHGGMPKKTRETWRTSDGFLVRLYERLLDDVMELRAMIAERNGQ